MTTAILNRQRTSERPNDFRGILYDLAIDPFDPKSVEKYKKAELAKHQWRGNLRDFLENGLDTVVCIAFPGIFGVGFLVCAMAIAWGCGFLTFNQFATVSSLLALPFFVINSIAAIFAGIMALLKTASWEMTRIYDGSEIKVPEFVQQTINDITSKVDKNDFLRFYICALTLETKPLDPFLIVQYAKAGTYGIDEYYIEVWNETYQKQRIV